MVPSPNPQPYGDYKRPEMHRFIPASTRTLLDVGCNLGGFGAAMKERGVPTVWGVEANPETAAVASTRLDQVRVGYFEKVGLPDHFFDVVCFNDVLEHMPDPAAALHIAAAKLKPGGIVVASLPNMRNFDNLMHIVQDKDFCYEECGIRDKTHLRFFTLKSIPRLFENGGFSITAIEGINENWWTPSLRRRLAFRLFRSYLADTRHMQYAIVARPKAQAMPDAQAA